MSEPVVLSVSGFPATETDQVIDKLWMLGCTGIEERVSEVVAGFASSADAEAAAAQLPNYASDIAPVAPLSACETYADVTIEDRFVIRPPWLEPPAHLPTDAIELVIDPGPSFGHGGHPTTRLALRAITEHMKPGDTLLDVGCGSGVLGIAAARLGAEATAFDIDPEAITFAAANAATNGVDLQPFVQDLRDIDSKARWDVVVANMPRPLLTEHGDRLRAAAGRILIVTGMLADQDVPRLQGDRTELEGWAAQTINTHPNTPNSGADVRS